MAQNLGLIFGKISDIARFYTEDNLGIAIQRAMSV